MKKNPEQIGKEAGRTEYGRERGATPRGISSGTTRPEEVRKARARDSETSSRGRRSGSIGGVRAQRASLAEGHLGKELPPHSVYMGRSWGSHDNPGGWRNPFTAETWTEQSRAAVVLRYREYLGSPSGRWVRYRLHELVGKKCFWTKCVMSTKFSR